MERKKILFVAEAVTLAHVGRPLALARTLSPQRYEVHFACAPGYGAFLQGSRFSTWPLGSISSARFLAALAAGKPVYDAATLHNYVHDDLRLLQAVRPDVVVGDFRLSLSVSARVAQVPYVGLINAYWSPYVPQRYTVPAIGLARALPIALADRLFRLVRPLAFALHSLPLNRVRRAYRLPSLGYDLRGVYADADYVLYPDIPEMFPAVGLPANHSYLGPVTWSPPTEPPGWWDALPADRPLVYVTLGSSGQGALLPRILQALAPLPLRVMAATAGQADPGEPPDNAHVAAYLPGEEAARRAQLVVCNGGSPTSQQALAAGVPVLGIAGNLDQYLNMRAVAAMGAGTLLRSDRLNEDGVRRAVLDLLERPAARGAAVQVAQLFQRYDMAQRFEAAVQRAAAGQG
ncbi:glycosyl transferase family 1 [Duganella sp. BJB488]|uniref:glycosyltransferase n=1 Tax=unclassified Duganella TaxID=2636909 RepID=UPI000E342BB2|nr:MULTISPECIES: glycosyltransferase [unclassified Duganella]RFP10521.1 glycosyl transferase family 1 [Duganella sp. BJB489]RFP14219.1 glycosyl transferase family 1 [Duganella sp. BJB488]RFP30156.1 glycosyl transferase family 1 [Duganella sp. BJB480]